MALLATGCSQNGDGDTTDAIEEALAAAAGTPSHTVDIGQAVRGRWTRLIFVCAYTDREYVEKQLGFAWPEFEPTVDDGAHIWVFATSREVVTWSKPRRYYGDPCWYEGSKPESIVARRDARFRVEDSGTRVLQNVPLRVLRPVKQARLPVG
jgi:hypothetical protein